MLGGEPDEALREVLSRADGQPFLLTELTVDTGLPAGWTEALLDTYRAFPTRHLPGRVLADLAVAIADAGDAFTHLATLRDQGKLFRPGGQRADCVTAT